MSELLRQALNALLLEQPLGFDKDFDQRAAIITDMLWKLARRDWHGVADCAMDLRELRL